MKKTVPFTKTQIKKIIQRYPTPFHIYDEKAIVENAKRLKNAFLWNKGFREYFAVKALPNPYIVQLLQKQGFGADCSSLVELVLAEKVGINGEMIMFTSNDTPAHEYQKAMELGAIINLDDISHIGFLEKYVDLPHTISFRYNPGPLRKGNAIIGNPQEAKYGLTKEQLYSAYAISKAKGIQQFGLHAMIASNELDEHYFIETASMLFDLVVDISKKVGITFSFINIGGGIGIPYHPEQKAVDIEKISRGIQKRYRDVIVKNGLSDISLYMESGRVITGPYGYLVTTVLHKKNTYKNYVGVDANMAHLMRPGMYGAYHHITVLGKERLPLIHTYDVTGSLCENNDKFAIDRKLPAIAIGDVLVIHDTGAHGHAMGFNYNGKLRSAELLLKTNGDVALIRRAETVDDYFRTIDFSRLGTI